MTNTCQLCGKPTPTRYCSTCAARRMLDAIFSADDDGGTLERIRGKLMTKIRERRETMTPEPRQWKHCEYCGHEMEIDGTCENCAIRDDEMMRQQWEYDYWQRIDAEDLADAEYVDFPDDDDWQD